MEEDTQKNFEKVNNDESSDIDATVNKQEFLWKKTQCKISEKIESLNKDLLVNKHRVLCKNMRRNYHCVVNIRIFPLSLGAKFDDSNRICCAMVTSISSPITPLII